MIALRRARRYEAAGFGLYTALVAAARDPYLYAALGVPDTLDGRFDMIGLYAFLVVHRLQPGGPPGPDLAQAVFDAMFSDMDINLREMGVGDLSVGKKVRAMWEAWHGRAHAYAAALNEPSDDTLRAALERNVWRGKPTPAAASAALARLIRRQEAHLAGLSLAALAEGKVHFLSAEEAAR